MNQVRKLCAIAATEYNSDFFIYNNRNTAQKKCGLCSHCPKYGDLVSSLGNGDTIWGKYLNRCKMYKELRIDILGFPKLILAGLANLPNLPNTGTQTIHV